ncbi:MAG: translesion error-prone DNA polymerase V autoproteolytic subunit [Bacteroidota bacterium]
MIDFIDYKEVVLLLPKIEKRQIVPFYGCSVSAGFPSPADDFLEKKVDLNNFLIRDQASTFLVKVSGDSMIDVGICHGDILIVDRSVPAKHNHIVVGAIDGEFTVKRLLQEKNNTLLKPENPAYQVVEITPDKNFRILGVVTFAIRNF